MTNIPPEVTPVSTNYKAFARKTAERAIKTFCETLLALIGTGAVNIVAIDWGPKFGISATAAVVSVLASVVSLPVGEPGTPSLVQ